MWRCFGWASRQRGPDISERFPASAARRLLAFAADYVVIALYIIALTAVGVALSGAGSDVPTTGADKIQGHLLAFLVLTLPVILYFALFERFAAGATPGKRLSRLAVASGDSAVPGLVQTFLRNALKFLPWELAHTAIWHVPGRPFLDPMPTLNLVVCIAALLIAGLYVVTLFGPSRRTPYDVLSRTTVFLRQQTVRQ